MSLQKYYQSFAEGLQTSANVKTIFGEPIKAEGRTIIPVARVAYGFGGGPAAEGENSSVEKAAGGGGGVSARPLGIFEVSGETTRFIPAESAWKKEGFFLLAGFGLGYLLGALQRRNNSRS